MKLGNYLNEIDNVKGWCMPELWNCIQPIDIFQKENGVQGPIAEIGVHHGKFFIGLALTKEGEGEHAAFDVFDMQEFNLDISGKGNEEIFRQNVKNYNIDNFESITVDSLRIKDAMISERNERFSLFSVDGCHMAEHTVNDFRIAMKMVKSEGIIFIDDYYNPNWPGVQEGMSKLYLTETCNFVPLLFTCNKLFLCSLSFHELYLNFISKFLSENYPSSRVKRVKRFGYETITVIPKWHLKNYLV